MVSGQDIHAHTQKGNKANSSMNQPTYFLVKRSHLFQFQYCVYFENHNQLLNGD